MKKIILANAVLAIAAAALLAQNNNLPPNPADMAQHRVQRLTAMLSLSASQQQQATSIFTNAATASSAIHANMKAAHDALDSAITSNDANAISQAANTIGQVTAQLTVIQATADAAFRQTLTSDQQSRLAQMKGAGWGGPAMHGGMHGDMHGDMPPGPAPF
jgi:Spy/CpxP family protein refolding chaperone